MASETIDYVAVLADLEAKRTAIENTINGLRQMLNVGADQSVGAPSAGTARKEQPTEVRFDTFFGMSTPDAIRKFLSIAKRPQLSSEIAKALQDGGLPTTSSNMAGIVAPTLSRMKTAGDVMPIQGRWALAEWYPAGARERLEALEKGKAKKIKKRAKGKKSAEKQVTDTATAPVQTDQPKKPTEEQIARIKVLHAAGKKAGEIAKETGVHVFNVTRILKAEIPKPAPENAKAQG
jgi:hypothetical protein